MLHLHVTDAPFLFSVYSNAMQENGNTLLYNGFIEELVDILEVKNEQLMVCLLDFINMEIVYQKL